MINSSNLQKTWNLTPLFDGDNDKKMEEKRRELLAAAQKFVDKWKDRSDYLDDPIVLRKALDDYENWARNYGVSGDEGYYFSLRTSQNQSDDKLKQKANDIQNVALKISNDIQFFTHRIAKISPENHEKFLSAKELKSYKHFLEKIFESSKYLLSEDTEKALSLKSVSSVSNWVNMTSSFLSKEERNILDEDEKPKTASFAEIWSLVENKNKKVRQLAGKAINNILAKHSDVAVEEMNSILHDKKVEDELRGFSRPDLGRHLSDDIDTEVVDSLINAVSSRFDISRRFYELKCKYLGVRFLNYFEKSVEVGGLSKKFSYEDSVNIVYNAFSKLDPEFAQKFQEFVENGNIDVYAKKHKVSGAFCASDLITQPTYILLNHHGELTDVLTLAHEMGHGLNDEYIKKTQNALNADSPLSTAEVSSTFFEDFALEEILPDLSEEQKLAIMIMKLQEDIGTIFRQVACYQFEQELHKEFRIKSYLSKKDIGEIFVKHMKNYLGDKIVFRKGEENWWIHWSHIRSYFYVYSYASGLLISKSMQSAVRSDRGFISKVKEFLSAGCYDSPKDIFSKMGIDITQKEFWDKGLKEIEDLLTETEALAIKLGKIPAPAVTQKPVDEVSKQVA